MEWVSGVGDVFFFFQAESGIGGLGRCGGVGDCDKEQEKVYYEEKNNGIASLNWKLFVCSSY